MLVLVGVACSPADEADETDEASSGGPQGPQYDENTFTIVSGSENEALEPIVMEFARQRGENIRMDYLGSLDIMLMLEGGISDTPYDAVWPANSLWLTLGDQQRIIKHEESIMRSPVVLGLKRSVAEDLGWVDTEVYVDDILEQAESLDLQLMMTSATQSNSGASAYFGYLYAVAGSPEVLTSEHINDPEVGEKMRRILATIDRSSGSSGWLKELFMKEYDRFDGMVNYEALIIEANRELVAMGREPLYAIYPVDGLAIADSPFAYVDRGNQEKEQLFLDLQEYLLSEPVQNRILDQGRRVGTLGLSVENADESIFNPAWGIDVNRTISPIRFPSAPVIDEALTMYQTSFRKGSFTIYCLDFSGSMEGEGERQLEAAMRLLLEQEQARDYLLQASPRDVTIVLPFNHGILGEWEVFGNDPTELMQLYGSITDQRPDGGTNIYFPVSHALGILEDADLNDRFPAIILMTDGQSNEGSFSEVQQAYRRAELDVPVFAITFGDASTEQLQEITELTSGRIYDGTSDLVKAFRSAKGNN
jgi:Ca-activated chloride channel family protein